jgi:hypothetical protein
LITISHSGPMRANSSRIASRRRRFMRFLRTARPSARGTVNPIRGPFPASLRYRNAVKRGPENFVPRS